MNKAKIGAKTEAEVTDYFPEPPLAFEEGYTFLSLFDADENSIYRKTNLYYPFTSQKEWEMAAWLLRSGLSMGKIDSFLSLEMINDLPLSFHSAKELRGRAETLPGGPRWKSQVIRTSHSTKTPVVLYWQDPLDCIASIFNHPLFHNRLDLTSRKVYPTAQRLSRVYTEWMTGEHAWNMQSALPCGATLLVLKFVHKKKWMRGVLQDWLVHQCLDVVLEPLKSAARQGVMLSDPIGRSHYCFTPLASYIADTLEAMMLACVGGKMSPVTMAMYKQFRDAFRHEPRTKSTTLAQLDVVRSRADPHNLEAFFCESQKFCLNGVEKPFWSDWPLAKPSNFFTPESLHHLHKQFYDHDTQWITVAVGDSELDFQFSVLQPTTGYRHFHGGILKLKQVTGRCHRDIQRSIIALSADAMSPGVMVAIRALMHFRYLVQSLHINDNDLARISAALDEFHANKHEIITAGVCQGKGSTPINNWHIPKLELMQSIIPSISNSGVIGQWFDLATGLLDGKLSIEDLEVVREDHDNDLDDVDVDADIVLVEFPSKTRQPGQLHPVMDYFQIAKELLHKEVGSIPVPLRSFVVGCTALHILYDPSIRSIKVDEAATMFNLPDLRPALTDFLHREVTSGCCVHAIGGPRRAGPNAELPFDKLQVWFKICLQETDFHHAHNIHPAQTLNCAPPSGLWTLGHYDTVIIQTNAEHSWPTSGLSGHCIAQIRLLIWPIGQCGKLWPWEDQFIVYVQRFDISSECDPNTQLHVLKRSKRSNGTQMGDIIPVKNLAAIRP
ncbi:uncharacterized protein F5147DRAFT_795944 [Suillus discolor]|uniref:DUF6830 domain-containing protein n=1 Tax=Suillus discolor TaxID=1912936 RepID=A0A9P7FM41_9AGAM|nr:uncharacterized protein F5147DRAFT_795944 [Suillus discolor]KAG2119808.1 hypothetical protein F5147DRAFT_795944 [Suillus discolor]